MLLEDLNINTALKNALQQQGLTQATPIQEKVFGPVLAGKDVCGIAQTGTGKTIAYLLPLLKLWKYNKDKHATVLILVPTRELVVQVLESIKNLTAYLSVNAIGLYGGVNIKTQQEALLQKNDFIVGTAGRVYDLAMNGSLKLKKIKKLVIDEVDELLNLGFRTQLKNILTLLPQQKQSLFFSATMSLEVENFIEEHFSFYQKIEAAPSGTPLLQIEQKAYWVPNFNTKINFLKYLLAQHEVFKKVLVFVSTKKLADLVFESISAENLPSLSVIHSNKDQNYRFAAVKAFEEQPNSILIATDLIARGIDVSNISHVINFDLPDSTEKYMHRIGRTGRADKMGVALSFFTEKEKPIKQDIEVWMQQTIPELELPEDVERSSVLIEDEIDVFVVPEIKLKLPKVENRGSAFQKKSAKNSKVNFTISKKERMMKKYGKPKTRGAKIKRKK